MLKVIALAAVGCVVVNIPLVGQFVSGLLVGTAAYNIGKLRGWV